MDSKELFKIANRLEELKVNTLEDLEKLLAKSVASQVTPVPSVSTYTIVCSVAPKCPDGLKYRKGDQLKSIFRGNITISTADDVRKLVSLYLDEDQKNGNCIDGYKLKKKFKSKIVLPAHLIDFFKKHQELIPEEWKKGGFIYFWSIYRAFDDNLYVRRLAWDDNSDEWFSDHYRLGYDWGGLEPAAVSAQS